MSSASPAEVELKGGGLGIAKVEVVASVDAEKLEATLRWVVDSIGELRSRPAPDDLADKLKEQADRIAALEGRNGDLEGLVKGMAEREKALGDRVSSLEGQLGALAGIDPAKLRELASLDSDRLRALSDIDPARVAAVAALDADGVRAAADGMPGLAERLGALETTVGGPDGDRLDQLEAAVAGAGEAAGAAEARAQQATARVADIEGQVEALRKALEAMGRGEAMELPPALERAAPSEEELERMRQLESRVQEAADALGDLRSALDALREELARKADRSQLDAMLAAMAEGPGTAAVGEVAEGAAGSEVADALNAQGRRIKALELALAALRDGVDGCARASDVAALAADVEKAKKDMQDLATQHATLRAEVRPLRSDVDRLAQTKADRGETPRGTGLFGVAQSDSQNVDRLRAELEDRMAQLQQGTAQTAYALLLLAVGARADHHTSRPPSRPGTGEGGLGAEAGFGAASTGRGRVSGLADGAAGSRGRADSSAGQFRPRFDSAGGARGSSAVASGVADAGDGGAGSRPGTAGGAPASAAIPTEGGVPGVSGSPDSPAEALEVLAELLDKGLVKEKGDKSALRRLAEWVDDNVMLRGGQDADWAARLKKLQEDIAKLRRQLKQLAQKEGAAKAGSRMADGDHAILSSKPLFGLRCMSCDRPLDEVQNSAGPFVPSHQFPHRTADPAGFKSKGGTGDHSTLDATQTAPRNSTPPRPQSSHPARSTSPHESPPRGSPSPGRQTPNWYLEQHGPPADKVPGHLVGPHLPPGGWRGTSEYATVIDAARASDREQLPAVAGRTSRTGLSSARSRQGGSKGVAAHVPARPMSSRLIRESQASVQG